MPSSFLLITSGDRCRSGSVASDALPTTTRSKSGRLRGRFAPQSSYAFDTPFKCRDPSGLRPITVDGIQDALSIECLFGGCSRPPQANHKPSAQPQWASISSTYGKYLKQYAAFTAAVGLAVGAVYMAVKAPPVAAAAARFGGLALFRHTLRQALGRGRSTPAPAPAPRAPPPRITRGSQVTPQMIREAMRDAPLKAQQEAISLQLIQQYVDMAVAGDVPSPVRVDNDTLVGARLAGVNLHRARFEGTDLRGADLSGSDLRSALLDDAVLDDANLSGARMYVCWARRASFVRADLSGALMRYAVLEGANFTGANLAGADLEGARLTGAIADETTVWPEGFDPGAHGVIVQR